MKHFLIHLVEFYQKYLSPDHSWWARKNHNPPYCKHYPTCSDYMKEAIEKKGAIVGVSKGTLRILRCMPWSKGGVDLVEKKK